jgi:putative proteasome-type protease
MYDVAELVGQALREVQATVTAPFLQQSNVDGSASSSSAARSPASRSGCFMVYSEGNFIESTPETPYFQIGESKYGKPVIDRGVKPDTSLL